MKVSFTPIEPGDTRAAAQVNAILDSLETADINCSRDNVREEGLDERALEDAIEWALMDPLISEDSQANIVDAGGFTWTTLVINAVTFQTTAFIPPTGEYARITASLQFPTLVAGPQYGVPSPNWVEVAIQYSISGVVTTKLATVRRIGGATNDGQWGPVVITTILPATDPAGAGYDFVRIATRADSACTYRVGYGMLLVEHLKRP